jgi:hypothetical protein
MLLSAIVFPIRIFSLFCYNLLQVNFQKHCSLEKYRSLRYLKQQDHQSVAFYTDKVVSLQQKLKIPDGDHTWIQLYIGGLLPEYISYVDDKCTQFVVKNRDCRIWIIPTGSEKKKLFLSSFSKLNNLVDDFPWNFCISDHGL